MLWTFLWACNQPAPIDVDAALVNLCESNAVPKQFELPVFEGTHPSLAVSLSLTPTILRVDGMDLAVRDLRERLREKRQAHDDAASRHPGIPPFRGEILALIAADTSARRVVEVLSLLPDEGFTELKVVGHSAIPVTYAPYVDPDLGRTLERIASTSKPEFLQQRLHEITEPIRAACPAYDREMTKHLKQPGALGSDRCSLFTSIVKASVESCSDSDARRLVTVIQSARLSDPVTLTQLERTLDPTASPLVLRPDASWGDTIPELASQSGDVWLAVR